jgi:hypothetical protein
MPFAGTICDFCDVASIRRRHSGRAEREPEPIGRNIVEPGPVLALHRSSH